jgi:putative Ca2+/H+ antiporter (TMEM165/GDT1 family)
VPVFSSTILQSFLLILVSEMGDKTQLLALLLVAKFQKPWTILLGILVATLTNHAVAAWAGGWMSGMVPTEILKYILGAIFIGFGVWLLIPDKDDGLKLGERYGAFWTTVVAFFLAEMGDKTQLATVALGAKFHAPVAVTVGTTAGMMVADGLAVFLGGHLVKKVSMKWIHLVAAILFVVFGIGIMVGL